LGRKLRAQLLIMQWRLLLAALEARVNYRGARLNRNGPKLKNRKEKPYIGEGEKEHKESKKPARDSLGFGRSALRE